VGNNRRCAVDDPNSVLINIATPGWNEYEEEVNCPQPTPQPTQPRESTLGTKLQPNPKAEGRTETACVISVIVAIVTSISFLL